jgi:hypothetical protein
MWPIYKKVITRSTDEPYLIRYSISPLRFIFGENNLLSKLIAVKIHSILLDDDACQHDHPWAFISIIIKGGYYEWRPCMLDGKKVTEKRVKGVRWNNAGYWEYAKWYGPGHIIFRKPKDSHRLELPHGRTCWTFVITFAKVRKWGFITRNGWVFWREYNTKEKC